MTETLNADLCIIGGGAGGLTVAAGASQMGSSVVLFERRQMGGDSLNHGCVPSKALLAAARAARAVRDAGAFGIDAGRPTVDGARVFGRVRDVVAKLAPATSVERLEGLGVRVIPASARFVAPDRVAGGGVEVRARRFVVATGSRPLVPPISGLDEVPYLTNETVFDRTDIPQRLIVLGGGSIGIELAQAHRVLGAEVAVIEAAGILSNDDPELVGVVKRRLLTDGVKLHEGTCVMRVESATPGGVAVMVADADGGNERRVEGTHLLVAAGRKPNVDDLGLDVAGIAHDADGITVDGRLRTANRRVFAAGDAAGGMPFTHLAGSHGGIVIRNALFRWPAKAEAAVPRVTYTEPELAQVGLTETEARDRHGKISVLRWPFHENDRAHTDGATDGLIKAITTPRGRILGVGIAGRHAGELIAPWVLAMSKGIGIGAMAQAVLPYPTLSEIGKRAGLSFFAPSLFSERTRRFVHWLARFG